MKRPPRSAALVVVLVLLWMLPAVFQSPSAVFMGGEVQASQHEPCEARPSSQDNDSRGPNHGGRPCTPPPSPTPAPVRPCVTRSSDDDYGRDGDRRRPPVCTPVAATDPGADEYAHAKGDQDADEDGKAKGYQDADEDGDAQGHQDADQHRNAYGDKDAEEDRDAYGMAFLDRAAYAPDGHDLELPYDADAIRWVQTTLTGSPVFAEMNTAPNLYSWGDRFAMFTGNAAVVGWDWHERQQRGQVPGDLVARRIKDVQAAYASLDASFAYRTLEGYGVQYVVVGELERQYAPAGEAKWAAAEGELWDLVYQNPHVEIFHLRPTPTPAAQPAKACGS